MNQWNLRLKVLKMKLYISKVRDFDKRANNNERNELNIEKENDADEDKDKLLTIDELCNEYGIALNWRDPYRMRELLKQYNNMVLSGLYSILLSWYEPGYVMYSKLCVSCPMYLQHIGEYLVHLNMRS